MGDFPLEGLGVILGKVSGQRVMKAFGEREAIGTTATGEDIWRGNELTPAPTSHTTIPTPASVGEQMTLVSESTADNGATATGVLTVMLEYIDAVGNEQTETVTMNGTTPVNTVATDIRFINSMHTMSAGSGAVAAGHIKIYKTGSVGLVYNMIALGGNKSLVPHRMVPAGHKLFLKEWHCSEAQGKRIAYRIRSTDESGMLLPGIFVFKDACYLKQSASPDMSINVIVPALTIVKVTGWAIAINAEGSASWWGVLIKI